VAEEWMPGQRRRKLHWRQRKKQRHAMIHNATKTLQNIMLDAASGNSKAYGTALRVLEFTHKVMQPTKDETSDGGPFPAKFIRPNQPPPAAPPHPPPNPVPPNSIVDADGTVYVEAE
jgi:hypothetical protein